MVKRIMNRAEVIEELAKRTSMFKKYVDAMLVELEDIVFENMKLAEIDKPSELTFFKTIFKIGAIRQPERMVMNAREGKHQLAPERNKPYAKYYKSLRDRISPDPEVMHESEKA